ncbi:hypothetical protein [Bacillus sp. BP-3]|uniref:hypothetical protein n=1 Tax=Bacillus sp. BP-3 TaxID=3022773 RepID=UPI00232CB710|nr:hypothetical protein [Bacillus sp. BP-3]MDC2866678.1 hypothetical protein [Bacillus sp. BP-3]
MIATYEERKGSIQSRVSKLEESGVKGTGNGSKKASQAKTAEQVITDRTKGLDLNPHPIQQKQLSAKKRKELRVK